MPLKGKASEYTISKCICATAGGKGVGDSPAAASQQLQHALRARRGVTPGSTNSPDPKHYSRTLTGLADRTAHVKGFEVLWVLGWVRWIPC
eukprot:6730-Heterococcus_DN1.PRE.2